MGSVSYEKQIRENKFLVDRLMQKLLQAGRVTDPEVRDTTWLFRTTLVRLENKTPKERLETLLKVFNERHPVKSKEAEKVSEKKQLVAAPTIPEVRVETQKYSPPPAETVVVPKDDGKRHKEEVNLVTVVAVVVQDDKDIAEDMRKEAREYLLKENDYILGTGMNESVIRRIVENTLHDFKQKKGLLKKVVEDTTIFDAVLLKQEEVPLVVSQEKPVPQPAVVEAKIVETKSESVKDQTELPSEVSDMPTIIEPSLPVPPETPVVSSVPEHAVQPQPVVEAVIVEEKVPEKPVMVKEEAPKRPIVAPVPTGTVTVSAPEQRVSQSVTKKRIPVVQVQERVSLQPQSVVPKKVEEVIVQERPVPQPLPVVPVPQEVLPQESPLEIPQEMPVEVPTPVVEESTAPERKFPPKADGIPLEDTSTVGEEEFFKEETEPIFKTRITSESKYASSGSVSKGGLAQAMRARAREQDRKTPLISHQQAIPMPQRFSGSKTPKVTEADIASVKIFEENGKEMGSSVPLPPKPSLQNVSDKKGIAWASNTKEGFGKRDVVDGAQVVDRHALLLQQKALIDKYVEEQTNTVLQVVSSEGVANRDDLEKLQKELMQESQVIANEKNLSISDKINKLDRMFMEKRNGYAERNNIKDTTSIEDMVDTVLARAGKEVRTKTPESDARFRETLRDTLHFKAKHLIGIGMDKNNIQSALDEEYVKHKAFYLKNAR